MLFFRIPCNLFDLILVAHRQVFQTFACIKLEEIGKRYLKADLRIDCDTPEHKAYEVYASIMIFVCELYFLGAFCSALHQKDKKACLATPFPFFLDPTTITFRFMVYYFFYFYLGVIRPVISSVV